MMDLETPKDIKCALCGRTGHECAEIEADMLSQDHLMDGPQDIEAVPFYYFADYVSLSQFRKMCNSTNPTQQ